MEKQNYLSKPQKDTLKDIIAQNEDAIAEKEIRDRANYSLAVISEHFARTHHCRYIPFGQPSIKESLIRKNRTYISDKI